MNKKLLVSLLLIIPITILFAFLASCSVASAKSPESVVKAYVNGLVKNDLEPFFSYSFGYRFKVANYRNSALKERWEELEKIMKEQVKEGLPTTIGGFSGGMDPICGIFYDIHGDELDKDPPGLQCFHAWDFLYEQEGTLKATVLEVRSGPLMNLNMEDYNFGIYEKVPTWEAFIRVKYLQQDTAPQEIGIKVKEVLLKMNVIKITSKNKHERMRVEQLGLGDFLVDGLTEIIEKVTWE